MTIDSKFINKKVWFFIHQTMCLKIEKKKLLECHNKNIFGSKLIEPLCCYSKCNTFCSWKTEQTPLQDLFLTLVSLIKVLQEKILWSSRNNFSQMFVETSRTLNFCFHGKNIIYHLPKKPIWMEFLFTSFFKLRISPIFWWIKIT